MGKDRDEEGSGDDLIPGVIYAMIFFAGTFLSLSKSRAVYLISIWIPALWVKH
jgi:hypothetical protein